jgi:hypothetical protein
MGTGAPTAGDDSGVAPDLGLGVDETASRSAPPRPSSSMAGGGAPLTCGVDVVLVEPLGLGNAVRVGELNVGEPAPMIASPRAKRSGAPPQLVENFDDLDRVDSAVSSTALSALLAATLQQR